MKYIKQFEKKINFTEEYGKEYYWLNYLECDIDIQNMTEYEISTICSKIVKWFPNYRFNSDIIDLSNTDPKYLKIDLKQKNYICLSRIYSFFDEKTFTVRDSIKYTTIDGHIFLNSNSKDDLIKNIDIYLSSNKYNL